MISGSSRNVVASTKYFRSKQKGVGFWGLVWGAAFFILVAILATKSIPVYLTNGKIATALDRLQEERDVLTASRASLLKKLKRRLNIDFAVTAVNFDKAFKVKKVKTGRELSVDYEVVIGLVHNASLLFDFKNRVVVTKNGKGST